MWSTRQVETLRLEDIVYVARLVGRTSGRMVGPNVALGIGVDEYIRNGFSVRSWTRPAARRRERRQERQREPGVCVECGRPSTLTLCETHAADGARRSADRHRRLLAEGKCTLSCGGPAGEGRTTCLDCADRVNARRRLRAVRVSGQ